MAQEILNEKSASISTISQKNVGVMGSRRIFAIAFKLQVLDSYRNDIDCRGNQRATARKFGIHRRQIQKWLQCEASLRNSSNESMPTRTINTHALATNILVKKIEQPLQHQQLQQQQEGGTPGSPALNLSLARLHGDANELLPPPPLPAALPASTSAGVAPTQQALSANTYARFHSSSSPVHYPQASYPFIDHHHSIYSPLIPPSQIPFQQHSSSIEIIPSEFQKHLLFQQGSAFERPVKTEVSDENRNYYQNQPLEVQQIKLERATSPDSVSLKRERSIEDDECLPYPHQSTIDYRRTSLGSSDAGSSLESLPPSPRESERSSASTPDSENTMLLPRRRSFSLRFKLNVLDAFYKDTGVAGNQRATARKFGINRRQVQKWLGQESELRGVIELCSNNRQRLGPLTSPVDLRTTELGPLSYDYADSSLTPPYSAPGCPNSCCQDQPYYCFSPAIEEPLSQPSKRTTCMQSCCFSDAPPFKKQCLSEDEGEEPLCLVKPKRLQTEPVTSTVPSPLVTNLPNKDAILFKPYLDNPVVSKPQQQQGTQNNNSQDICNMNDQSNTQKKLEKSFKISEKSQHSQQLMDLHQVKSAFVRYPINSAYYA